MRFVQALFPAARVDVTVREPYFTWADTTRRGGPGLLDEIEVLRHLEAGGTDRYYHGIFAAPRLIRSRGFWQFVGIAFQPGRSALTASHEFASTLAHEVGHNMSLGHAPCGGPFGVDVDFPYQGASTGVWGYEFSAPGRPGRLFDPRRFVDLMSYCRPYWISDYNFRKAMDYRMATAATSRPGRRVETLLLWGGIRDGRLRLEPTFGWRAPVKVPERPGPYRLAGYDAGGAEMFSFSFAPDQVDHGGRSFLFAIPFRPAWRTALQAVALSGPEGLATRDMAASARLAVFTDPATGRIRSVAREWSGAVPARLRAAGPVEVAPGWRR